MANRSAGAHPAGSEERLSYTATPYSLEYLADNKVDFKQEVSFQGGDGFLYFVTPAGALAVITRILEHMFGDRGEARNDPITKIRITSPSSSPL